MKTSRILVVDDNPTNLKLTVDVLQAEDCYELLSAIDAESALQVIRSSPPDLILMDVGLPGMDGLTLTRQLKSADDTQHIVIIALTAFAMKDDETKAIDAGCDAYMSKPIDVRALSAKVAEYLSGAPTSASEEAA